MMTKMKSDEKETSVFEEFRSFLTLLLGLILRRSKDHFKANLSRATWAGPMCIMCNCASMSKKRTGEPK